MGTGEEVVGWCEGAGSGCGAMQRGQSHSQKPEKQKSHSRTASLGDILCAQPATPWRHEQLGHLDIV